MLWGQIPTWGHLGSQGSKGHFHQSCSNLSILNSLTIILKHMHELETPTYVVGSKINLGSLGILQKRTGFVSFQRHTVLVLFSFCNSVNMLTLDRHPKLFTVSISSDLSDLSDLWLKGQRRVTFQTIWNGNSNSVSMLTVLAETWKC